MHHSHKSEVQTFADIRLKKILWRLGKYTSCDHFPLWKAFVKYILLSNPYTSLSSGIKQEEQQGWIFSLGQEVGNLWLYFKLSNIWGA